MKRPSFITVAPGVTAMAHDFVDGKCGVVAGGGAVLVVDTPFEPEEAAALDRFLAGTGASERILVYTHGHLDHVAGSAYMGFDAVYAHAGTALRMRAALAQLSEFKGRSEATIERELAWPAITTTGPLSIELGGLTAVLIPTPGHSPDGLCVHVPAHRALFAGDTLATGIVPALQDGDSGQMIESLRVLRALELDVLVPGHGPVVRGREAIREVIDWTLAYLERIRGHVQSNAELDDDQILTRARYRDFVGERFHPSTHGMGRRHELAVSAVIAEQRDRVRGPDA